MKQTNPLLQILFATSILLAMRHVADAQLTTNVWNVGVPGANGWSVGGNWNPAGPPGSTSLALFGGTGTVTGPATVNNVVDTNTTVGGLTFTNIINNQWHVTQIPAGSILTVNGHTQLGLTNSALKYCTSVRMFGAGEFDQNGPLSVGYDGETNQTHNLGTETTNILDLANLSVFRMNAPDDAFNVLSMGWDDQRGWVTLASNTFINVKIINVVSNFSNARPNTFCYLGSVTNVLWASELNLGVGKSQTGGLQFTNNATTGSVVIGGLNGGTNRCAITVGATYYGTAAGTPVLSLLGHSASIMASTLVIGLESTGHDGEGGGSVIGTVQFDNGTLDATSISMGNCVSNFPATGVFNVGGDPGHAATLMVNLPSGPGGGSFLLGAGAPVGSAAIGNLNISTNGTAVVYCGITRVAPILGSTAGNIFLNHGTLNIASADDTIGTRALPMTLIQATNSSTLVLTNSGSLLNAAVTTFNCTNSTVHVSLDGLSSFTNIVTTSLNLGGTVVVQADSVANVTGTVSFPIFSYTTYLGPATLASPVLPAPFTGGAVTNDAVNHRIMLTLTGPLAGAPRLTGFAVAGNNVTLSGTNLPVSFGRTYEVLSSTDVIVPLSNWKTVASGVFAVDGGFTNQASVSGASRFFLIHVP